MKYMGSKKNLLKNGLGELIIEKAKNAKNFYDPFCGSASVVWFASSRINNKIFAGDLQLYSVILASAILLRNKPYDREKLKKSWLIPVQKNYVEYTRKFNFRKKSTGFITSAYAGHYFSYDQALKFDLLYESLPKQKHLRMIAHAALIIAASNCVASPGHTAQPFQPTNSSLKFILESWSRDPFKYVYNALEEICSQFTITKGLAEVSDAYQTLQKLKEGDLVFIDAPYSGVHYSRFYHVLETIARGQKIKVNGTGRYPHPSKRPQSLFSMKSTSYEAFNKLLKLISEKKSTAILTFPNYICSNGISGSSVKEIAQKYFHVEKEIIKNRFSTLGGNKIIRPARLETEEMILTLGHK